MYLLALEGAELMVDHLPDNLVTLHGKMCYLEQRHLWKHPEEESVDENQEGKVV